ncbi:MAG: hypothetical protein ACYSUD_16095 [Planctomycetota bacterium]|jgi:hypothetical protein
MKCEEFERALLHDEGEKTLELASHARACASCRKQMEARTEMSRLARQMHKTWESRDLWPNIQKDLRAESMRSQSRWQEVCQALLLGANRQWKAVAAVAFLGVASAAILWVLVSGGGPQDDQGPLLTEQALLDVERAEAEYIESIDRLSALVGPKVAQPASSLLSSYREKLMLLDAAISECRESIERNRFNAHLRGELLSIYQEKQKTLQELIREN